MIRIILYLREDKLTQINLTERIRIRIRIVSTKNGKFELFYIVNVNLGPFISETS